MTEKTGNSGRAALTAPMALGVVCLGLMLHQGAVAEETSCPGVAGTYITTYTDREGVFSSRGLMTFLSDGVLLVSDSAQGGVPGVWDPFSTEQGAWRCEGTKDGGTGIRAVALNFVLPRDGRSPSFSRVDYQAMVDTANGKLTGNATLSFYGSKDLEGADPVNKPGRLVDEFALDGALLKVH